MHIEKLSTVLCNVSEHHVLKHHVRFANKDSRLLTRKDFYSFVQYDTKYYRDVSVLTNVNLAFKSFITLEEVKLDNGIMQKNYVQFSKQWQIDMFRKYLKSCKKWLTKEEYKDLYYYKNGQLIMDIDMRAKENMFRTLVLANDKIIKIMPSLTVNKGKSFECAKVLINDSPLCMNIESLLETIAILKRIDLYQLGLQGCNLYFSLINQNKTKDVNIINNKNVYNVPQNNLLPVYTKTNTDQHTQGGWFK